MSITWLTPDWPVPALVRALSTWRQGGVSSPPYASLNLASHVGDGAEAVEENRSRLRRAARLPAEPTWLTQVHGARVVNLDRREEGARAAEGSARAGPGAGSAAPVADGAITRRPGVVCAILTADCLPLLLAADCGGVVAAAHVGWRGLAGGIIEATVGSMETPSRSLVAWLGPAIGPEHFEVGAEVREALLGTDPGALGAFRANARGRFMADLAALARGRLARLGVERICGGGECTYSGPDKYFSHRRDGTTGRQATLIWLEDR